MRLSSSILFLGCWLTRQWQMARGIYTEPSISVIPSPNVALGGHFYISCGSPHYKATFQLFKGESVVDRLYINVTVIPGEVIALEGNANIHCKTEKQQEAEFTLHIKNSSNTYESKKMGSGEVLFPIINAKESDGGIYHCSYCLKLENTQECSNYSDEVHIKVTANTFTSMEINIRLGVAGLVLLSLVLIVAEFLYGRQG
ncbi:immunoglobulin superfamily member 1-like [Podarcis lilfordi]|nr:immunoglobulin superfamily member 1-like [Podarcis lilfordi]